MVKCKENYIGKKYGYLTVIEQAEDYIEPKSRNHKPRFLCECDCQKRIKVNLKSLKSGLTTSCGCVKYSTHKPMKDNDSLVLNIVDSTHKPYGKCKTYNIEISVAIIVLDVKVYAGISVIVCGWHILKSMGKKYFLVIIKIRMKRLFQD